MKKRERGAEEEAGGVGVCEGAEEIKYNLYVMCDFYLKKILTNFIQRINRQTPSSNLPQEFFSQYKPNRNNQVVSKKFPVKYLSLSFAILLLNISHSELAQSTCFVMSTE